MSWQLPRICLQLAAYNYEQQQHTYKAPNQHISLLKGFYLLIFLKTEPLYSPNFYFVFGSYVLVGFKVKKLVLFREPMRIANYFFGNEPCDCRNIQTISCSELQIQLTVRTFINTR